MQTMSAATSSTPVVKVINVFSDSEDAWEAAGMRAVYEAFTTVDNVCSVVIEDIKLDRHRGRTCFKVTTRLSLHAMP